MNKEEIEKDDNYWKGYIEKQKEAEEICKICKYRKKHKELEQKESILDKVIEKLKEIRRELDDDGGGYYAQEITKILNIIEGEKNNGE